MNHDVYVIGRVVKELVFFFESNNFHGTNPVLKVVRYDKVVKYGASYYNLALGDFNERDGYVYDNVVTNNGDMRKVLMTVVNTMETFFRENPEESIYIEGSDPVRNAFYQKIIRDYHNLVSTRYFVNGCREGKVEAF